MAVQKYEMDVRELEREKIAFQQEVASFRNDQQNFVKNKIISDDILELSVRGVTDGFMVPRSLLCSVKETALEAMFSGRHEIPTKDGKLFVNRNPATFKHIVDYLSNN